MKSCKAMKSRFKVTGTGKLVRHKQGRRHILTKKSSKHKRHLAAPDLVKSSHLDKYKMMMGVK
ncbi:MAG: 50S ribosomal protein L35 [Simkaniaceae bacterium]|nr:50S ribosomal protein L35 [Simkaniaceae bacterium]MCF7851780.1 50S ribosomal protein L35 [Simkaniaceae bacterium]